MGLDGLEKEKQEDKDSAAAAAAEKLSVTLHVTMHELSLRLISIEGGWFLIQRTAFDMAIGNEPYHALQILYQASSLRYLGRGANLFSSPLMLRSTNII